MTIIVIGKRKANEAHLISAGEHGESFQSETNGRDQITGPFGWERNVILSRTFNTQFSEAKSKMILLRTFSQPTSDVAGERERVDLINYDDEVLDNNVERGPAWLPGANIKTKRNLMTFPLRLRFASAFAFPREYLRNLPEHFSGI